MSNPATQIYQFIIRDPPRPLVEVEDVDPADSADDRLIGASTSAPSASQSRARLAGAGRPQHLASSPRRALPPRTHRHAAVATPRAGAVSSAGLLLGVGLAGFVAEIVHVHASPPGRAVAAGDGPLHAAAALALALGIAALWRSRHDAADPPARFVGALLLGAGGFAGVDAAVHLRRLAALPGAAERMQDAGFVAAALALLAIGGLCLLLGRRAAPAQRATHCPSKHSQATAG